MQVFVDAHGDVRLADRDSFTAFVVHAPTDYEVENVGNALRAVAVGEIEDGPGYSRQRLHGLHTKPGPGTTGRSDSTQWWSTRG